METKLDRVRAYYDAFDEWGRLESPEGARELRRALEVLDARLAPGSRILDLGGGPGRYAVELARRGHRIALADLSPAQLEVARGKLAELGLLGNVDSIDQVNAADMSTYGDASFDAVVAFGPFYHLVSDEERRRAAGEIHRVLRPNGQAFVAFIPRVSGLIGLVDRAARNPAQVTADGLRRAADTGVFSSASETGFQEGYYPLPDEIAGLFEASGFSVEDTLSLKSIANELADQVARLAPEVEAEVERLAAELCRRPEVIATSGHVLLVARKRA